MTNQPNVAKPGAQDANPAVSDKSVAGETNQLLEIVTSLANEVKELKSNVSGIYSRQDKDRNQMRDFMDDFQKFKSGGMTDDAAYKAAEGNQNAKALEKRLEDLEKKISQPTGNGAIDAVKVIQNAGLDMDDPKVKLMAGRQYNHEGELYEAIGKLVATKSPEHSSAQDAASSAKTAGHAPTEDEMSAELLSLYNNPTQHEARIKELEKALGW